MQQQHIINTRDDRICAMTSLSHPILLILLRCKEKAYSLRRVSHGFKWGKRVGYNVKRIEQVLGHDLVFKITTKQVTTTSSSSFSPLLIVFGERSASQEEDAQRNQLKYNNLEWIRDSLRSSHESSRFREDRHNLTTRWEKLKSPFPCGVVVMLFCGLVVHHRQYIISLLVFRNVMGKRNQK